MSRKIGLDATDIKGLQTVAAFGLTLIGGLGFLNTLLIKGLIGEDGEEPEPVEFAKDIFFPAISVATGTALYMDLKKKNTQGMW